MFLPYYRLIFLLTPASGHDVSKDFQRLVNKRMLPDYFDIIKEPRAFSTLRVCNTSGLYIFNIILTDVTGQHPQKTILWLQRLHS
jgi:hypothetical protein